jgi:aspartyl-tRNA(Asn)/glutamyl-tRNA(Gln) amidotransferase subunit A
VYRFPSLAVTRAGLLAGSQSPQDVVEACLSAIGSTEPAVRAWTLVDAEGARARARALGRAGRSRAQELPLWGIPLGIKDVIDVAGLPTTASSRVLAGNVATSDAAVVATLRAAGAIILGKTNTQEFAYGAVSPPTTNPWNPGRIPGGSSGGSAAALAAGHCAGALGTDTSGSIRIPSALCGVVGLKPRPGQLALDGIIPLAPSLDAVGPMARSVEDVCILWDVASGGRGVIPEDGAVRAAARNLRVAAAPLATLPELEVDVEALYVDAVAVCARLTRYSVRADVPEFAGFDGPRAAVQMSEALEVHRSRGWWPAHAGEYTEETRGYLEYAERELPADVVAAARQDCAALAARLGEIFDHVDVLLTPTVACEAPTHAQAAATQPDQVRRPVVMKLTRIPGVVNVAGLAALSVPCGFTEAGLPVGLQIIGRDVAKLLCLGRAFEAASASRPTPPGP